MNIQHFFDTLISSLTADRGDCRLAWITDDGAVRINAQHSVTADLGKSTRRDWR